MEIELCAAREAHKYYPQRALRLCGEILLAYFAIQTKVTLPVAIS